MVDTSKEKSITIDELLKCCPTNKDNYEQLLHFISRRVVIPFLGAGFSANAGYPSWSDFLRRQAEKNLIPGMIYLIETNQLIKAASLLEQKVTRVGLENILLQTFGDDIYKTNGIDSVFEILFDVFQGTIITTNFDTLIETLHAKVTEEYLEKITPKTSKDRKIISQKLAYGEPMLIKLHGDVAVREFVLTEKDYDQVYGTQKTTTLPMPSVLRDILRCKILLFVGCSLEGDRTLEIIENVKEKGIVSFAFLSLPECTNNEKNPFCPFLEKFEFSRRVDFLIQKNIIPIWYPYERHDSLKIFLNDMKLQLGSQLFAGDARVRREIEIFFEKAKQKETQRDISGAYYLYGKAEDLIKMRPETIAPQKRIYYLQLIRIF